VRISLSSLRDYALAIRRFPGLTSGACAYHRFAIHKIAQLQNWRFGLVWGAMWPSLALRVGVGRDEFPRWRFGFVGGTRRGRVRVAVAAHKKTAEPS